MPRNTEDSPSRRNLRPPWPKGVSGNPKGRPLNPFQKAIREKIPPKQFAAYIHKACEDGDSRVLGALLDRYDPKPEIAVKLSGDAENPLVPPTFRVEFVKPEEGTE